MKIITDDNKDIKSIMRPVFLFWGLVDRLHGIFGKARSFCVPPPAETKSAEEAVSTRSKAINDAAAAAAAAAAKSTDAGSTKKRKRPTRRSTRSSSSSEPDKKDDGERKKGKKENSGEGKKTSLLLPSSSSSPSSFPKIASVKWGIQQRQHVLLLHQEEILEELKSACDFFTKELLRCDALQSYAAALKLPPAVKERLWVHFK